MPMKRIVSAALAMKSQVLHQVAWMSSSCVSTVCCLDVAKLRAVGVEAFVNLLHEGVKYALGFGDLFGGLESLVLDVVVGEDPDLVQGVAKALTFFALRLDDRVLKGIDLLTPGRQGGRPGSLPRSERRRG